MNKIEIYLKCVILLINILVIENKKIIINERKQFSYIQNSYSKHQNGVLHIRNIYINNYKRSFFNFKKKDNVLLLFKNGNVTDDHLLNNFNKLLEWIMNKKNEYIFTNVRNGFTIKDLTNCFQNKLPLHNIKFIHENRNNYGYIKNKIKDFVIENKVQINKDLELYLNGDIHEENNNTCNTNMIKSDNKILCMKAKKKIKKSEIICSIPSTYIINFDNIINQIQKYIDYFNNSYNVNYIKYIFKNNLEDEIKELDSLTILKYDIYQKHTKFLNFIKSPNIYLKYWDMKLTLIIAYIYFISKYINILLYSYNFNNTFFHLMNNYFKENLNSDGEIINNILHNNLSNDVKKKHEDTKKDNNNNKNNNDNNNKKNNNDNNNSNNKNDNNNSNNNNDTFFNITENAGYSSSLNSINKINCILKKEIESELENNKTFFFYKNYDFYINYIIHKKELNHLPLHFSDSSFFLFNNTNIKNIIYFRRQMIHEIINFYEFDENNNNFFFIDRNIIHKILFTNNKYYHKIQHFKNCNIFKKNLSAFSKIKNNTKVDLNKLYQFILVNENYSYVCIPNNYQKNNITNEKGTPCNYNSEIINENNDSASLDNFENFINSYIYDSSLFESFDNFFNYKFLMHIYSYISSHAVKMKNKTIFNDKEKKSKGEEERYHILKDSILNTNITMENKDKVQEQLHIKECSKYDFNEFEKKEREKENKSMCLIPLIDICNHSNFYTNSIIKKDIKKEKISLCSPEDYNTDTNIMEFANCDSEHKKNFGFIKKSEVNEIENEIDTSHRNEPNKTKENMENISKNSIIESVENVHLISTRDIEIDEEITVSYGNLSNDLLLLEYGFIHKKDVKVYFNFDVKVIREIIIQVTGFDKLPLMMLESLEKVKLNLFKKLNMVYNNDNVYERFDVDKMESTKIIRKKSEILNDYLRKNKYFNEYNIFKMKDRINKFFIDEKVQFSDKKNYLYIGSESIVDPILLATIRIIIYDDIDHLSKVNINDLLKWEKYLSVPSEMIVLQVLIKLCDEIVYQYFYDINYEEILKEGNIKYSNLKFLQNKFLHMNLFNSDQSINVFQNNNFNIVMHNIIKLKELQKAKLKLTEKFNQIKNLLKN